MYVGLHVKYRYSSQIVTNLQLSRQIFEKYSNVKFHENPSNGSRIFPCGRTDRHNEAKNSFFFNFTNVPNKTKKKTVTNRDIYISPGFDRNNIRKSRGTNLRVSPVKNFLHIFTFK